MSTVNIDHVNGHALGLQAMGGTELAARPAPARVNGTGMAHKDAHLIPLDTHDELMHEQVMHVRREVGEMPPGRARDAADHLLGAALEAVKTATTAARELRMLVESSRRDVLTDTPDRLVMRDRLERAVARARRRGTHIAVMFVDLDGFKRINDTLGHAAGDEALRLVARRLESAVRESDTVSRHGGDEFLVLLADVEQPADAVGVAANVLTALRAPAQTGGHALALSASLGVAIFPEDGKDVDSLIAAADRAMYRAKRAGGGGVRPCRHALELAHGRKSGVLEVSNAAARSLVGAPAAARQLIELVETFGGTVSETDPDGDAGSTTTFVVTLPKA